MFVVFLFLVIIAAKLESRNNKEPYKGEIVMETINVKGSYDHKKIR